jgi:hypothetical protein
LQDVFLGNGGLLMSFIGSGPFQKVVVQILSLYFSATFLIKAVKLQEKCFYNWCSQVNTLYHECQWFEEE